MRPSQALKALLLALALPAAGCDRGPAASPEEAIERALAWLADREAPDGAWHSEHYGVLRAGHSLTALALAAIARLPAEHRAGLEGHVERGFAFLVKATDEGGAVGLDAGPLDYPNYTSAYYLRALVRLRPPGWKALADKQVAYLRSAQLGPEQGWSPEDDEFGGFSLGGRPLPKPEGGELLSIAVTRAVLEALRVAGVPADDEVFRRARVYVERCQSYGEGGDGGFFYTPAPEGLRSKAGLEELEGKDPRPRSYGTATCDGIRALVACGAEKGDPRLDAAVAWLHERVDFERVPGMPEGQEPPMEPALRVYWYSTLAPAMTRFPPPWYAMDAPWKQLLFTRLRHLQTADGSFVGLSPLMKEDDPLVSTLLALLALSEL